MFIFFSPLTPNLKKSSAPNFHLLAQPTGIINRFPPELFVSHRVCRFFSEDEKKCEKQSEKKAIIRVRLRQTSRHQSLQLSLPITAHCRHATPPH
jgi:hypothetical protein